MDKSKVLPSGNRLCGILYMCNICTTKDSASVRYAFGFGFMAAFDMSQRNNGSNLWPDLQKPGTILQNGKLRFLYDCVLGT